MKLDFTALNNLYTEKTEAEILPAVSCSLESIQRERQQLQNINRIYQENIKAVELQKADILKGIKCGKPNGDLLLAAVQCISALTNDDTFYRQVAEDIEIMQWLQTGDGKPAVQDMKHRLELMKRCIENELQKLLPDR